MATFHFDVFTQNIITASKVKGIGPIGLVKLLKSYADKCSDGEFVKKHFAVNQADWNVAIDKAKIILDDCNKFSIKPVIYSTEGYPQLLAQLSDAPAILYVKGSLSALQPNAVAVIGSRKAHEQSKKIAFRLGQFFAEKGATVVSGLALGCDTEGHSGALSGCGITVAVLAHGLDMVYPACNQELADKIVEGGGALVSEYGTGVKPYPTNFVQRDRIQSGLSKATVVVQTTTDGGSMHTSRFCLKQNRILAAWYPNFSGFGDIFSGNFELLNSNKAFTLREREDLPKLWDTISGIDVMPLTDASIQHHPLVPPSPVLARTRSASQPVLRQEQGSLFSL